MIQFIKYNIIGIINTLITLIVVWILHECLDWNLELSNLLGFVAGGINSYLFNRIWNFKSHNKKSKEFIRFAVVFLCAYGVNLFVLEIVAYSLTHFQILSTFVGLISNWMKPTYFAHVVANIVYVLVSFTLYKKWVFKNSNNS